MVVGDKCNPILGATLTDGRILIGENTQIPATLLTVYSIAGHVVTTRDIVGTRFVFDETNKNPILRVSNLRIITSYPPSAI